MFFRATIERLKGDLNAAENILLSQRDHKRAIIMFSNAEQYVRALKVAEEFEPKLVPDLIAKYQGQLAREGKTFQLAEVLAYSGAMKESATLYLGSAFQPLEAYRLLIAYPAMVETKEGKNLHERVLPVMQESGLDEMVGRLLELVDEVDGTLRALRAAHCYEYGNPAIFHTLHISYIGCYAKNCIESSSLLISGLVQQLNMRGRRSQKKS